jgi:hypothetical protein
MSRDQYFEEFDQMEYLVGQIATSEQTKQFKTTFRFLNSKGGA